MRTMNKKPKIILFDIDGVLLNLPYYFSEEIVKMGYKEAHNVLQEFYSSDAHKQSLLGKEDLAKLVEPRLREFGWEKSCEEYFNSLFEFESKFFDKDMISLVEGLRDRGIDCMPCTDKTKIRFNFVLDNLKDVFVDGFASCNIGFLKTQEGFWEYAISNLKERYPNIAPEEIAFFDDKQANIDVSLKFGLNSFLFTGIEQFKKICRMYNL